MPFKSKKQERYMWANHPDIARRWEAEYGTYRGGDKVPKRKSTIPPKHRKTRRK